MDYSVTFYQMSFKYVIQILILTKKNKPKKKTVDKKKHDGGYETSVTTGGQLTISFPFLPVQSIVFLFFIPYIPETFALVL